MPGWRGRTRHLLRRNTPRSAALLAPTRIYVKAILAALRATGGATGAIKALSHITGGGLSENLPRVVASACAAEIDLGSWQPPAVFQWLAGAGHLDDEEMLRTFNCGIGMVAIVDGQRCDAVCAALVAAGETPIVIGEMIAARGIKSQAKGKGEAEAVAYRGRLFA